jgi:hypothetical protein
MPTFRAVVSVLLRALRDFLYTLKADSVTTATAEPASPCRQRERWPQGTSWTA